jgi:hypothetical protein
MFNNAVGGGGGCGVGLHIIPTAYHSGTPRASAPTLLLTHTLCTPTQMSEAVKTITRGATSSLDTLSSSLKVLVDGSVRGLVQRGLRLLHLVSDPIDTVHRGVDSLLDKIAAFRRNFLVLARGLDKNDLASTALGPLPTCVNPSNPGVPPCLHSGISRTPQRLLEYVAPLLGCNKNLVWRMGGGRGGGVHSGCALCCVTNPWAGTTPPPQSAPSLVLQALLPGSAEPKVRPRGAV